MSSSNADPCAGIPCYACPNAGDEQTCPRWQNFRPPETMQRQDCEGEWIGVVKCGHGHTVDSSDQTATTVDFTGARGGGRTRTKHASRDFKSFAPGVIVQCSPVVAPRGP